MKWAVQRLRAHIQKDEQPGRDSFGQMQVAVLCGAYVSWPGSRTSTVMDLDGPLFYYQCGNCLRIQRQRETKAAKEAKP